MNSITQEMRFRQSLMKYCEKYGVKRASRKYNKSRSYIYFWKARWDGTIESLAEHSKRPHHHPNEHTPDELKLIKDMRWHRLRKRGYIRRVESLYRILKRLALLPQAPAKSTYKPKPYEQMTHPGECVQTDNGPEFTTQFIQGLKDKPTLFQTTAVKLGIRHKLIRPYTPLERSHCEDHYKFYSCHSFYFCDDLNQQLKAHLRRSNDRPMCPLGWLSPIEFLSNYRVQHH